MKKLLVFMAILLAMPVFVSAAKWKGITTYEVQKLSNKGPGQYVISVAGYAGGVDGAMENAMVNAVAAAFFQGWEGSPALLSQEDYEQNEAFFKNFFKKDKHLKFCKNLNLGYPSGDNNISTKDGRRVVLNILIKRDELIDMLDAEGLRKKAIGF